MKENHISKNESMANSKKSNRLTYENEKNEDQKESEMRNKINLDYDWNTEYGDGDIPDVDKL